VREEEAESREAAQFPEPIVVRAHRSGREGVQPDRLELQPGRADQLLRVKRLEHDHPMSASLQLASDARHRIEVPRHAGNGNADSRHRPPVYRTHLPIPDKCPGCGR
jgi:hypothetical protein